MNIAFVGVRGVPHVYSGFETAVTEIGKDLVARGHSVRVYCRRGYGTESENEYCGIKKKYVSRIHLRFFETLSHTLRAIVDILYNPVDVVIVCNVANAPLCLLLALKQIPFIINVDGFEWQRKKWPSIGKSYFFLAAWCAAKIAPLLICDSIVVKKAYEKLFHCAPVFIPYGGTPTQKTDEAILRRYGLCKREYYLVVARLEPENNTDLIISAFQKSTTKRKLAIVGGTAFPSTYVSRLHTQAQNDRRICFLGEIYDQKVLRTLLEYSFVYVHGHMVGGTNPILVQALASKCCCLYLDVPCNKEVVGSAGIPFLHSAETLYETIEKLELCAQEKIDAYRNEASKKICPPYTWKAVTTRYENVCYAMMFGNKGRRKGLGVGIKMKHRASLVQESPFDDVVDFHLPALQNRQLYNTRKEKEDFIKEYAEVYRHMDEKRKETPWPKEVIVEITQACNFSCRVCESSKRKKKDKGTMPLNFFEKIIRCVSPHADLIRINGYGESTTTNNFMEYIAAIEKTGFSGKKELITNGSADPQTYTALLDKGYALLFSWDATEKKRFEYLRQGACYEQLEKTMLRCTQHSAKAPGSITLLMTINHENLSDVVDIIEYAKKKGITKIIYNLVNYTWHRKDPKKLYESFIIAAEKAAQHGITVMIPDHIGKRTLDDPFVYKTSATFCTKPWEELCICYTGEVIPCNMFNPYSYGFIKNEAIEAIEKRLYRLWNGPNADVLRKCINTSKKIGYCRECYYMYDIKRGEMKQQCNR